MMKNAFKMILIAACSGLASGGEIDVYLFGGQSNMQGIGKIENLPRNIEKEIPHTYYMAGRTFQPFVLGKTRSSAKLTDFGPEVGFSLTMATSKKPIYIIKHYASGQPLHHGWSGGRWVGDLPTSPRMNFYPGKSSTDKGQGVLYNRMLNKFVVGLDALKKQGHKPVIKGFVWMQGEQDSKHKDSAIAYAASLKLLHQRLTEDLKLKKGLPMVFGQVLPHKGKEQARFTHQKEIRQEMALADGESSDPKAIKMAKMVSTDDCKLLPDKVHYNAEGLLLLGKKFATAMKAIESNNPQEKHR